MLYSKNLIALIWGVLIFTGCDSPLRHKVDGVKDTSEKIQEALPLEQSSLQIKTQWAEGPFDNVAKASVLVVYVYNSQNQLSDLPNNKILGFYATMPSMGHPLDSAGEFIRLEKGIYMNSQIKFNMGGEWLMELWIFDLDYNIEDRVKWLTSF